MSTVVLTAARAWPRAGWVTRRPARTNAAFWMVALLAVVAVMAAVAAIWPAFWHQVWLVQPDQQTNASSELAFRIWVHNFGYCIGPIFLGAVAHAARRGGSVRGRSALLVAATIVQFRNPIAIGTVGGLDPHWLLASSAWWLLELSAMAIALSAMWRAWQTNVHAEAARVLGRAVIQTGCILVVASVIELALT